MKKQLVLVVDDVNDNIQIIANFIRDENIRIAAATTGKEALDFLDTKTPALVLLDLGLPDYSGEEILEKILEQHSNIQVIIVSATNDPDIIVNCMKMGAIDYLVKPIEKVRTLTAVKNALHHHTLKEENRSYKQLLIDKKLSQPEVFSPIITQDDRMHELFCYLELLAQTDEHILITGETGVGKELFAQAVHKLSGRPGEMLPVNIASLDDAMFSDTLFGHKRGAYTGANESRKGVLEATSTGTVFLDEIGDISQQNQIKLLRLLENGEYMPAGSDSVLISNARLVVATNRNLKELINSGLFRQDVYYRLNQHHIHIPPLRERKDDIKLLLEHFIKTAAEKYGKSIPVYPAELINLLETYSFPGNVRELKSMVFNAVAMCRDHELSVDIFKLKLNNEFQQLTQTENFCELLANMNILPDLKFATDSLVQEAMKRSNNNQKDAAEILGLTRSALCKRLQRG